MARYCKRKSELGARRDMISELPENLKESILECLPTRDAARTALLSTHWKDVWLHHGRLVFDRGFFECFREGEGDRAINIINNILMLRVGPVRKFTLGIPSNIRLQQSDFERWCLFLSRNGVEELNIDLGSSHKYKLPVCIVSCPTIKILKLQLYGSLFRFPVNARCLLPSLTSLALQEAWFNDDANGIVFNFPNLEKLAFEYCHGIKNFKISAPKLSSLYDIGFKKSEISAGELRWFTVYLETIKALYLSPDLLVTAPHSEEALTFPMAINLQVIHLHYLSFACGKHFALTMQLLQKSPNLCKLEIVGLKDRYSDDKETALRILEDPDSYVMNQNLNMLHTVKIESFAGSRLGMLLVKTLLSKSPALEKVTIQEPFGMDPTIALKIARELLCFPRASPKVQVVFVERKPNYRLVGLPGGI